MRIDNKQICDREVLEMSKKYKQYTPLQFKKKYPEYWYSFPKYLQEELLNDSNYIIRTANIGNNFGIELGYAEDEWLVS